MFLIPKRQNYIFINVHISFNFIPLHTSNSSIPILCEYFHPDYPHSHPQFSAWKMKNALLEKWKQAFNSGLNVLRICLHIEKGSLAVTCNKPLLFMSMEANVAVWTFLMISLAKNYTQIQKITVTTLHESPK